MTQRHATRGQPVYIGTRDALEAVRRGDQEFIVAPVTLPNGQRAYRVRLLTPHPVAARRPAQSGGPIVSPWVWAGFAASALVILAGLGWAASVVFAVLAANGSSIGGALLLGALVLALVGGGCTIVVTVRHRH